MQLVVIQVEVLENIVFALKKCVSAFYSIIESWGGICGGCVPFFFFFFSRFKWIKWTFGIYLFQRL